MVIDFHTHTFPDSIAEKAISKLSKASHTVAFANGTSKGLLTSMSEAGIDISVVLPVVTNPDKTVSINDFSAKMNQEKNGLVYFGGIHPQTNEPEKELKRIKDMGIKGIKIHPVYQGTPIDDIKYLRILDKAGELGLIVVTHGGNDIGFPGCVMCSPKQIANAVRQVGNVRLVSAHLGGWRNWDEVFMLCEYKNILIDTSFSLGRITPADNYYSDQELNMLNEKEFVGIVNLFGEKRVLFGTDSPWGSQKEELQKFKNLPIDEDKKEYILYKNAKGIL